jgi:hypothetical protein
MDDLTPFARQKILYFPMRLNGRYKTEQTAFVAARSVSPGHLGFEEPHLRQLAAPMHRFRTGARHWLSFQRESEGPWLLFEELREHDSDDSHSTRRLTHELQGGCGGEWELGVADGSCGGQANANLT